MPPRARHPLGEMPFLDHLEEFRWRLLWSLMAVGVGTVVGFLFVHYGGILDLLIRPIRPLLDGETLRYFNPVTPFFITLKLSIIVGLLLAIPIVVYQIWAFLAPALKADEKRIIVPALYFGLILFCTGVALAYFYVLPLALVFLTGFQQEYLTPAIEVGEYLSFVTRLLLAFGAVFELPVVVMILSAMGLMTPAFMRSKRRHAILALTVMASLLTPGDLASTLLMLFPMMFLYEISILLSAAIQRRRALRDEEEGEPLRPSSEPPSGAVELRG
jgi:sec-independent protein translocase protein TatC